jgi:hypothetical protein
MPSNADILEKVELFVNKYPFDGEYTSVLRWPIESTSDHEQEINWSFPVHFDSPGVYRLLAHAEDSTKHNVWDEIVIYTPHQQTSHVAQGEMYNDHNSAGSITKIAIVNPTFTSAAYGKDAFYTFYEKYDRSGIYDEILPTESNVTTDLNMLTAALGLLFGLNLRRQLIWQ